ncbi:MAG: hypothetical protein LBF78_11115 [Treponema sp.]|jgi:hypothetical protein|nr:hypothetical protein [Treponema sp.]
MKHKLLTVVFVVAVLAALVSCDTGTPPTVLVPPESPITFTGTWLTDADSVSSIVRGPRYLTVNDDWSFVYTGGDIGDYTNPTDPSGLPAAKGGFSQARQNLGNLSELGLGDNFIYYPPIIVEGKLIYVGDGYYDFAPQSGRIDLRMLKALQNLLTSGQSTLPDYTELPGSTVQNFKEYAKISLNSGNLVVDDHPDSVTGGIGFLNGTWDKQ